MVVFDFSLAVSPAQLHFIEILNRIARAFFAELWSFFMTCANRNLHLTHVGEQQNAAHANPTFLLQWRNMRVPSRNFARGCGCLFYGIFFLKVTSAYFASSYLELFLRMYCVYLQSCMCVCVCVTQLTFWAFRFRDGAWSFRGLKFQLGGI